MNKTISPPPSLQDQGDQSKKTESNHVTKKGFLGALISTIFSTTNRQEKKQSEDKYKEVQLSALKTQQAFIEEYNKIQDKTSTLSRKQRDYVVVKVEAMIENGIIKKV